MPRLSFFPTQPKSAPQQVIPGVPEIQENQEISDLFHNEVFRQQLKAFASTLFIFCILPSCVMCCLPQLHLCRLYYNFAIVLIMLTIGICIENVNFLKFLSHVMVTLTIIAIIFAFTFALAERVNSPKSTRFNVFESVHDANNVIGITVSVFFFLLFGLQSCVLEELIKKIKAQTVKQQVTLLQTSSRQ